MLGNEGVPLWTLDDCHSGADQLCAHAAQQIFERRQGDYYPGLRAPVPPGYAAWIGTYLGAVVGANRPAAVDLLNTTFAIACDDPAELAPIQLIPHFDGPDEDLYATVHYLCRAPFKGTAFYRHRRTGFERITAQRLAAWHTGLAQDSRQFGMPAGHYIAGSSPAFEQIAEAALRFNRMIVYPANCLHSGMLDDTPLSNSAGGARLTITTLARITLA